MDTTLNSTTKISANPNALTDNTVVDSLKFLEKVLNSIIQHTEAIADHNKANSEADPQNLAGLPQYVANKLQGVLALLQQDQSLQYCDVIAKTANNETFSMNALIQQFKQLEWIVNGYHTVETRLVINQNFNNGMQELLGFLLQYCHCNIGAMYLLQDNRLKLVHQVHSSGGKSKLPAELTLELGGFGALLTNQNMFIGELPAELLGEPSGVANNICSMPLVLHGVIQGVVLLSKDLEFTSGEETFLKLCRPRITMAISYNRNQAHTVVLETTVTNQAHKIQNQDLDLQQQHENLTAQKVRAEALEKKTLSLSDAINQKTQLIELLENKLKELELQLNNQTQHANKMEQMFLNKEQDLHKITEKYNIIEKQIVEKNHKADALQSKLTTAEKTIATQMQNLDSSNAELQQIKAIMQKQHGVIAAATNRTDALQYTAAALQSIVTKYFNATLSETMVLSAKQTIAQLILDLQEFADLQNNTLVLTNTPVSLNEVFAAIKQEFMPRAIQKGLAFSVEQYPEVANFQKTDPSKLVKVVYSLLNYAFKNTDIGAISIKAYHPDHVANKKVFAISVADTGTGMSAEKQKHIFSLLMQEPGSEHAVINDCETSLTLKLAYEYAKLLGGELHVQSQEGLGTTFTLYLPIADCNQKELQSTKFANAELLNMHDAVAINVVHNKNIINTAPNASKQPGILVMQDDLTYKQIQKMLASVVQNTELVTTADLAYKKLKTKTFSCLIISLQHPDLPGFKWIMSQLKRDRLTAIPCILYVPYTMNTRENELAKKYMRDYGVAFVKNTEDLLTTVLQNVCLQEEII